MTKQEFISILRKKLNKFPNQEVEDRISFYSEIIDDSIEEGLTEEEAVLKIGNVDEIVKQIASEIPLIKIVKNNAKANRKFKTWELTLLIVGAPLWFSLLIALFAGIFSICVSLWAVVVAFYGVAVGFIVGGIAMVILGCVFIFIKSAPEGLVVIGTGLILTGVGILFAFVFKYLTKSLIKLTKLTVFTVKKAFVRKGE